jgi:Ca-activated chloride channel family protein
MNIDLLEPARLWLLLVVAALGIVWFITLRWRRTATLRFTQIELLDQVAPRRPQWRRYVVAAIQLVGLAVAVVAIARPVDSGTEILTSEGQILMLLDVSLSMDADDVDPNRLAAAQEAALEFIRAVDEGVEVGLISFSGTVAVEVAPTLDRGVLERAVEDLELAEATAIGEALAVGTELLVRSAPEPGDASEDIAPGTMVLLSDGETTVGRLTSEGAAEAAEAGIPVYTIAFGTPGGEIVDPASGDVVPVPVRPADLQLVADATGGAAFEASTGSELADSYDEIRDSLGETLGEEIEIVEELTWRWALAAFLLLALAWGLGLWWLRGMV